MERVCGGGPRLGAVVLLAAALGAGCGPSKVAAGDGGAAGDLAGDDRDRDGDGYSVRAGDCNDADPKVHPGVPEVCFDRLDQDCNGVVDDSCDDDRDGYAIVALGPLPGGDCDDGDPLVNPGAYEIPGNGRDDDCDGAADEPVPACDAALDPTDPLSFGRALGACPPWLVQAAFHPRSLGAARAVQPRFGTENPAREGQALVLLSTGAAYLDDADPRYQAPRPGSDLGASEPNPLPLASTNVCTALPQTPVARVNDLGAFTLTLRAPTNARGFRFRFDFFSAEYAEYVGFQYNDSFAVELTASTGGGNVVLDGAGQPITVDSGLFKVCLAQPICDGIPHAVTHTPACQGQLVAGLHGTGYDAPIDGAPDRQAGGATGWLTTTVPITPGETFTLRFLLFDAGDHVLDSAVLIDDFAWLFDEPPPTPVTG